MTDNPFQDRQPNIDEKLLRRPQYESFYALKDFFYSASDEREVGIVLPVGCGKSGCVTLAPFAFRSARTLVVAPGLKITTQLYDDFDPTKPKMFYQKCKVLQGGPYPEPVEIRGNTANRGDLDESHVAITNIQQLQGDNNRWLATLPDDYFDLIIFDEGHHSVADTYENVKNKFPNANILNLSATPFRSDGQKMPGRVLNSFSISDAIQEGYVKHIKGLVLNPKSLKYVRREDSQEIEVSLEEVKRLGEDEADFRRSIVTSKETLTTIVDASIRELDRIRDETGDSRHKIIAAALNYEHCHQIVEAYRARGKKADFVHTREDSLDKNASKNVLIKLEANELDVIVQVRKLSEGFDHPYLSVAAVFSVFSSLSPFVQFVGRIMRVIKQNSPYDAMNQGTVIFHAGANIASRWEDFQEYSEADKEYFNQLLPLEELNFSESRELSVEPLPREPNTVEVRSQADVSMEEVPLLDDDEAMQAINTLRDRGYSPEDIAEAMKLSPVPTTKVNERRAARAALDVNIKREVGKILGEKNLNPQSKDLDKKRLNKTNFVILKSSIDKHVNEHVGKKSGERQEFNRSELDSIKEHFSELITAASNEVFNG